MGNLLMPYNVSTIVILSCLLTTLRSRDQQEKWAKR